MNPHYWTAAVLAGFGVIIVIIGVVLYFVHGWQRLTAGRSKSWPSVVGTITSSSLEKTNPKSNMSYVAAVRYSYRVGGEDYASDRIFWGPREGREKQMADLIAVYPTGKDVWVQYDPQNPANAVLRPEMNTGLRPLFGYALALMMLGLVAFGAGLYALSH
jgi:hypothetical protein